MFLTTIYEEKNQQKYSLFMQNKCLYIISSFSGKKQWTQTGDNTEKIWVHQFFGKQKTDMTKACKMAAEGLGSAVSSSV